MEAVGAVAGVVSIVGIIGQSIDGILKLRKLVHGISNASETVRNFMEGLETLKHALMTVRELAATFREEQSLPDVPTHIETLRQQAEKCHDDIGRWIKHAEKLNTNSMRSTNVFFKKLHIASDANEFSEFHRKVASHQQGFQFTLGILGRSACFVPTNYD